MDIYCDCEGPKVGGYLRLVKARKPHKCCDCKRAIEKGEEYCRVTGIWDEPLTFKVCASCEEVRRRLQENDDECCVAYGELEEYILNSELVDKGDDEIAQGRYCAIATTVPWLKMSHGRFQLVK